MPVFKVEVDFEVYCDKCGEGLCQQSRVTSGSDFRVYIAPCQSCLDAAEQVAYEEGYDKGYDKGYEDRKDEG